MKQLYKLVNQDVRRRCWEAIKAAPEGHVVTIAEPTRSLDANAALWAFLSDISAQVEWYGKKLTPEDWKNVFSASLRKLEVVPNLDGSGFVALGQSTSKMTKREFSDLLELIQAFGAERGVKFMDNREFA
jgi:hypothetical protein